MMMTDTATSGRRTLMTRAWLVGGPTPCHLEVLLDLRDAGGYVQQASALKGGGGWWAHLFAGLAVSPMHCLLLHRPCLCCC